MDNPYQPPRAELLPTAPKNGLGEAFEPFSTWYVFGLSIVTLNLYPLYWMYSRTQRLNTLQGIEPIGATFVYFVLAINIVGYPLGFAAGYFTQIHELATASDIVDIVGGISLLIWAFAFRNRLNSFLETGPATYRRLTPVMTFFFQSLYLSYKLNENLELERSAQQPASESAEDTAPSKAAEAYQPPALE
jgi:hypothetical protein